MTRPVARRAATTLAAMALGVAAILGTTAAPAGAAYSSCPTGYHCFFSGTSGSGAKWQFAGSNSNLTSYGISTQSSYNHGTSGLRHCGFRGINKANVETSTVKDQKHTYSARPIRSNAWTSGTCTAIAQ